MLNFTHLDFIKVSIVVKHLESQDTKSLGFDPKEIGPHFKAKQEGSLSQSFLGRFKKKKIIPFGYMSLMKESLNNHTF